MSGHRPQLIEYLGNECAHCSMAVDKMVRQFGDVHHMFKFHHVVSQQKSKNYKNLIERKSSAEQLDEIDKIEKSSQRILANHMACQRVGGEVRQAPVARFPYSILYVIEPDECIRVIAVAHQKRRPGYWRERLQSET